MNPFTDPLEEFLSSQTKHDVERPREGPAREFRPDEAERQFQGLGDWKHPDMGRAAREYWLGAGAQGVEWLVRRLRGETHVEVLHDAAALLADSGRASIRPIIEELDRDPATDQAPALLRALARRVARPANVGGGTGGTDSRRPSAAR